MEPVETKVTYDEHLTWCKKRALEYLDRGDIQSAIASMLSDIRKHPEGGIHPMVEIMGLRIATGFDVREARRYIEGFR